MVGVSPKQRSILLAKGISPEIWPRFNNFQMKKDARIYRQNAKMNAFHQMKIQYITTKNQTKITCPSDHNEHSNNIRSTNKTNQIAAQFVRRSIWRMGGRVYFSNSFLRNHHDFIGFALH